MAEQTASNEPLPTMSAEDVVEFVNLCGANQIEVWLDGGWGVDALFEEQTRTHSDLDVVVQQKHVLILRSLMDQRGFKEIPRDDTSPWNFVLADGRGRELDVHVIELDQNRNGIYGPPERGTVYPASSLNGTGGIAGNLVKCTSAEWQVKSHSGYELHEKDHLDVRALCERFGLPLPVEFEAEAGGEGVCVRGSSE